jgi:hypothetical protein
MNRIYKEVLIYIVLLLVILSLPTIFTIIK